MPITRKKSKTIQDTTDGFYISTDPEPVIQNPLNRDIVADRKTSNTNMESVIATP